MTSGVLCDQRQNEHSLEKSDKRHTTRVRSATITPPSRDKGSHNRRGIHPNEKHGTANSAMMTKTSGRHWIATVLNVVDGHRRRPTPLILDTTHTVSFAARAGMLNKNAVMDRKCNVICATTSDIRPNSVNTRNSAKMR